MSNMVLTSSRYLWLVVWEEVRLSIETYLETYMITQIANQARKLIYRLITKPQMITLASTYILCHYPLYSHNFIWKTEKEVFYSGLSSKREAKWLGNLSQFLDWRTVEYLLSFKY